MNWYMAVLKKYFVFSGRARRKEFWFFVLFSTIISILLSVVDVMVGTYNTFSGTGLLSQLYSLAVFIPYIAVTVRRLHDINKSGWWIMMPLGVIIIVGIFAAIVIPSMGENASPVVGVFIGLVSLASMITMLVFLVTDSDQGPNKYGENPKNNMEPVFNIEKPLQQFQNNDPFATESRNNKPVNTNIYTVTLLGVGHRTPPITIALNTEIIVGRSANANIVIDNKYISGQHLSLHLTQNNEVVVTDLGSSNGTYIQGIKLTPNANYTLHQNEHLVIGSEDIVYTI